MSSLETISIFIANFILMLLPAISPAQWVKEAGIQDLRIGSIVEINTVLFAGTNGGLFRSTDNGTNWIEINPGIAPANITALGANETDVFIATNSSSSNSLLDSTDYGVTWLAIDAGLPSDFPLCLAANDTYVLVGFLNHGVYLSTNSGGSWRAINSGLDTVSQVNFLTISGENFLAGTRYGGLFLSTNKGETWTFADPTVPFDSLAKHFDNVTALFAKDSEAVAATLSLTGIRCSRNAGVSWTYVNTNLPGSPVVALALNGQSIFAATVDSGVFLSRNGGTNWTEVDSGLSDKLIFCLGVDATDLFAGTLSGIWRRPLSEMTAVDTRTATIHSVYHLDQNYPNPFNPSTVISYNLPTSVLVVLNVYDALGRMVETLVDQRETAGNHSVTFNASHLSSGVYFYRLSAGSLTGQAGTFSETKKLLLVK
ncbi:MAG TPA: T9SS type A sorting domain-containing protein [Candidatus Kryptonia bacterium]